LPAAAEPEWELHNLTADPEERKNLAHDAPPTLSNLKSVIESERYAK
jgi:arylsulfatase A-like enzyme